MSFFAKFFKPNKPLTTEERISQLEQMNLTQLVDTVNSNEPDELKVAAIKRLEYSNDLVGLALNKAHSPIVSTSARRKIGELLDSKGVSLDQLSKDISDENVLFDICGYSTHSSTELVARLDDENLLLNIAQHGSTTQIRQAASNRVEARENLEVLLAHAKGKDKSVYKIVKTKLEKFKEEKAQLQEARKELSSICYQAEQLAKRNVDDVFFARLEQLKQTWNDGQDKADESLESRFNKAIERCQDRINQLEEQKLQEQQKREKEKQAKSEIYALLDSLNSLIASIFDDTGEVSKQSELDQLCEKKVAAVQAATERGVEHKKELQKINSLTQTAQNLIELNTTHGSFTELLNRFPENDPAQANETAKLLRRYIQMAEALDKSLPQGILQAKEKLTHWQDQKREEIQQREETIKKIQGMIRRGNGAITQGHVGRSRAILRDLEELLDTFQALPGGLQSKFEDFKQSVEKLGDWHEFAVAPKKDALVQEMKGLINSSLAPQDLANKIQALQSQWKLLCRGGQNQDEELWQAFQSAAQQAYEPCQHFFETQNLIREENAAHRRTLIQQLSEYLHAYDWDSANWPEVENTLRAAREAWQSFWPIARKEVKPLQEQFDQIMDKLYDKLNAEYEKNRLKKAAIVEQSSKLSEQNDIQVAIDEAKRLQRMWRDIGRCKRKDDRSLWQSFRENCDAVFERRQQETDNRQQERTENQQQAISIIEKIESISTLKEQEFFTEKSQIGALIEAYQAIGEFPKDQSKALAERYKKALEKIDQHADQLRHEANAKNWQKIFELANAIRKQECASESDKDALENITEQLQQHDKWPGNTYRILERRVTQLSSSATKPSDSKTAEEALRMVCIKAEVAKDTSSPEEDKPLRMQYQVNQLKHGLNQQRNSDEHISELLEEWLSIAGASDTTYQALLKRFSAVLGNP